MRAPLLLALAAVATVVGPHLVASQCPFHKLGTPPPGHPEIISLIEKKSYQSYLKTLDIHKLYDAIEKVMRTSQECWPADGPQARSPTVISSDPRFPQFLSRQNAASRA